MYNLKSFYFQQSFKLENDFKFQTNRVHKQVFHRQKNLVKNS